jgi:hypothetical protein
LSKIFPGDANIEALPEAMAGNSIAPFKNFLLFIGMGLFILSIWI